jgi:hypothetical protein
VRRRKSASGSENVVARSGGEMRERKREKAMKYGVIISQHQQKERRNGENDEKL